MEQLARPTIWIGIYAVLFVGLRLWKLPAIMLNFSKAVDTSGRPFIPRQQGTGSSLHCNPVKITGNKQV